MTFLAALDAALVLLFTLRLTRFVVRDDLGQWLLVNPLYVWAGKRAWDRLGRPSWRAKAISGLDCPFCVGMWIGALVLLSLLLVGGFGSTGLDATVWRWVAGVFALNEVVGHLAVRLGDTSEDEDDA